MRFFTSSFSSYLPRLMDIQQESFSKFINQGIIKELSKRTPISNPTSHLKLIFYPQFFRLSPPQCTIKEALRRGKSYNCKLYVPVQLINRNKKEIYLKWIIFGDLPLMTERGHFILNGSPRVLINQLVRSPGIYYQERIVSHGEKTFYADLVPQRGAWLRLEIDKKGKLWARMKRVPKIRLFTFLQAFGLKKNEISNTIPLQEAGLCLPLSPKGAHQDIYMANIGMEIGEIPFSSVDPGRKKRKFKEGEQEAFDKLYLTTLGISETLVEKEIEKRTRREIRKEIRKKGLIKRFGRELAKVYGEESLVVNFGTGYKKRFKEDYLLHLEFYETQFDRAVNGYQFLFRKFLNPRIYDLGEIGRDRLNQKLELSFSQSQTTITIQDLFFATNHLLKCRYGTNPLDDIDHLKNRRIRASGELLQNQFGTGLIRLEKTVREKMERSGTLSSLLSSNKYTVLSAIQGLVTVKPLNGALREFFGSSPLSQYMDQTNPLAEITHKRRITSIGPGGVSRETAGMAIRGIHPTYYGRICPIETPEGKQAGLVNSITTYARINPQGFLETPYYKVLRGQAQKSANVTFFSAEEEEKKEVNLAPGDFKLSSFQFLPKGVLPFQKRGEMKKGLEKDVDYVAVSAVQMISVATSLIPFLEHNDANRALMGSNMQRQAVPLIKPERPLVGTGLEARVVADSGHGLQAKGSGFVEYVSGRTVTLRQRCESFISINLSSIFRNNYCFHLLDPAFGAVTVCKQNMESGTRTTLPFYKRDATPFSGKKQNKGNQMQTLSKGQSILSSQETDVVSTRRVEGFSKDKTLLCSKKQFFTWQNIQTDLLWHKYSIEKSKFNFEKNDHFLPEIEYLGSMQSFAFCFTKCTASMTFFSKELKNFKNLKKTLHPSGRDYLQPVEYYPQKLAPGAFTKREAKLTQLQNKVRDQKRDFLQSQSDLFDADIFSETKKKEQNQYHKNEKIQYQLQNYQRSNQATCLHQYPAVEEGNWVEKGDLVANCSASTLGELALGKNVLLAYMPWDGYNFEDAILISDRLVNEDVYTSIHIERYEISIRDTEYGLEEITTNIPNVTDDLTYLNQDGVAKIGSWVKEGDILVGKVTPIIKDLISPYEKLLYSIIQKGEPTARDTSLRAPKGIQGRVISYEIFEEEEYFHGGSATIDGATVSPLSPVGVGVGGEKEHISLENSHLTNRLQEETDSSVLRVESTSFSSKRERTMKYGSNLFPFRSAKGKVSTYDPFDVDLVPARFEEAPSAKSLTGSLGKYPLLLSIPLQGGPVEKEPNSQRLEMDILTLPSKGQSLQQNLLIDSKTEAKDVEEGTEFFQPAFHFQSPLKKRRRIKSVQIYIVEKRRIQVGDKLAGRHGNKGIVSRILPKKDMPYLPDGTPVDIVLNPLGVPSRMNVGQVYECLLGLAAGWLGDHFKITPFDEIYGPEASRSLVYLKLYQARLKTGQKWLFNPQFPGKVRVFDGRTGDRFDQAVTIGRGYILKLVHMVDEKIHARSTGPYSLVTQQPVRGRSKGGGQRVGEMEVWALEGFGAAYALQELLTVKSDDVKGRRGAFEGILKGTRKPISFQTPESFKLLLRELQCLCLDLDIWGELQISPFGRIKIDVMNLP